MKTRYRVYFRPVNKLLKLMTIIIFVSSLVFILSNMFFINVTIASKNKTEWQVTLNISESDGASDTVIFGEKDGASDGQDQYDIPKPPSPQEPYIRSWFTTSLDPPYDTLWEEYRESSDDDKVWNLTIIWFSETTFNTNITISWDVSEVVATGYDSLNLNALNSVDMKVETNYQFTALSILPYTFQIILKNKTTNDSSGTNEQTSLILLTLVIIILIIVIIAIYLMKIKK